MQNNPLSKYYRQPKIYLSLPSGGKFNPPDSISGDPANLPVFGMTAMDEILFKTPDALFTGEAVVQVIQSCIPDITQPWNIPQIDIDSILIAMRIATYGEKMPLEYKCSECGEPNEVELYLPSTLDYYNSLTYQSSITSGDLKINFRPLTYAEQTQIALHTYQLQRQLFQITRDSDETEQNRSLNAATKEINQIQYNSFRKCIHSVEVGGELVTDPAHIDEWFSHSDRTYYKDIKDHLLSLRKVWSLQDQTSECSECKHVNTVSVGFDNSNFFGSP